MSDDIFLFDESGTILKGVKNKAIKSITIPDSVTSIWEEAFRECSQLISITIPNSVTSIGTGAFYDCTGLTSVTIPNSVTSIGTGAFYGCTGLTSVTIPDGTTIGTCAFYGCTGLTSVTIPQGVTFIGFGAFEACSRLKTIKVDLYNPKYDSRDNCNAIIETTTNTLLVGCKNTTIPDSVTSIGNHAFHDCSSLESVTIPDSVTSIGVYTFYGCSSLTSITIPDSVTSIGWGAFSGCKKLPVENYIRYADTYLIEAVEKKLSTYQIKYGTRFIGHRAFEGCTGLTSIDIPDGVTIIEEGAFRGCTGLTSVTIPDGVTSIEEDAFLGCTGLTSVTIPNSVTSIGDSAFGGCTSLVSIIIPEGVTSIGEAAFYCCTNLKTVTIPDSVTSIRNMAFLGCPIYRVYLPKATDYLNDSFDKITEVVKIKVFISYSWDDEAHKAWVEKFATDLNKYVHVILDQWDLRVGNDMAQFMEQSVSQSNKVLCILTPNYKQKCDSRKGGSGFEFSLISAEIVRKNPPSKFIPILRFGDFDNSCPTALGPRLGLDFSSNDPVIYKEMLKKLLSEIKEESLRPD